MSPIVEGGKATRTHQFLPTVPSQDVSRYKAVDPNYWLEEAPDRVSTAFELATRGVIRWWLDRAPAWLVLTVVLVIVCALCAFVAGWIVSDPISVTR